MVVRVYITTKFAMLMHFFSGDFTVLKQVNFIIKFGRFQVFL